VVQGAAQGSAWREEGACAGEDKGLELLMAALCRPCCLVQLRPPRPGWDQGFAWRACGTALHNRQQHQQSQWVEPAQLFGVLRGGLAATLQTRENRSWQHKRLPGTPPNTAELPAQPGFSKPSTHLHAPGFKNPAPTCTPRVPKPGTPPARPGFSNKNPAPTCTPRVLQTRHAPAHPGFYKPGTHLHAPGFQNPAPTCTPRVSKTQRAPARPGFSNPAPTLSRKLCCSVFQASNS